MAPAAGQGSLALEARAGDTDAAPRRPDLDRAALVEFTAERAATSALGATCETPLGICARHLEDTLAVAGYAGLPDGSEWVRDAFAATGAARRAGEALAERMLAPARARSRAGRCASPA